MKKKTSQINISKNNKSTTQNTNKTSLILLRYEDSSQTFCDLTSFDGIS